LSFALVANVALGADAPAKKVTSVAELEQRAYALLRGGKQAADPTAAARLFEEGARAGSATSQWALAGLYLEGTGVPRDLPKGFALMEQAAKQGLAEAQSSVAWMLLSGHGTKPDPKAALRWLAPAARQGSAHAYSLLARMYMQGEVVARDPKIAAKLMRRSAELGDARSAVAFGTLAMFGPVELRNQKVGMHFLEKAAGVKNDPAAHDQAAYTLAQVYLLGQTVPRDASLAAQWMARAAEAQHELAQLWLSELYAKGLGVPRDAKRAADLLEQALARASVAAKNEFAWQLAVNQDETLRNGLLAVRIMEAAVRDPEARRPAYLDTLAAAHAEAGDFASAVARQSQAIEALAQQPRNEQMQAGMKSRLEDYRAGKAYREAAQ
jgi:TPR repeat protein